MQEPQWLGSSRLDQQPAQEFVGGLRTLELSTGTEAFLIPLPPTAAGQEIIDFQSALDAARLSSHEVIQIRIIYQTGQGVSRADEIAINQAPFEAQ